MALPQLNAADCARPTVPSSGVQHINHPHRERFTVVGDHLAQHRELSYLAIGLATHIQSLRPGTKVSIKALAERACEGEVRIAAALRELEAHGYLARTRERLPSGRVVTRTVSYNNPPAMAACSEPQTPAARPVTSKSQAPAAPRTASTPLPTPAATEEEHAPDGRAAHLLTDLRRHDPRLLLSERDVRRLAPAVVSWLERDASPEAVRRTLTAGLPDVSIRHPAALLAHRLAEQLPPPLPAAPSAPRVTPLPPPLQNCDACDRAFRSPEPGRCRDCRNSQDSRDGRDSYG